MTQLHMTSSRNNASLPAKDSSNASENNILTIGTQTYNLNDQTPMMVQYLTMKAKYPNALLLYRMGDFYELFFEDAKLAAQLLDITLTRRGVDKAGDTIAMAGVPFHAAESYMARLIAAGQTVVVCEQVADDVLDTDNESSSDNKDQKNSKNAKGNKKGLMHRAVVKTLTAGTLTDDTLIAPNQTPTVVAIDMEFVSAKLSTSKPTTSRQEQSSQDNNRSNLYRAGVSQLDLNAGRIRSQYIEALDEAQFQQQLLTVLTRFAPSEAIINETLNQGWRHWLQQTQGYPVVSVAKSDFHADHAAQTLCEQFGLKTLDGIGIGNNTLLQTSSAALIHYAQQTQQRHIPQIDELIVERDDDYLIIDEISSRNLELFDSVSPNGTPLISIINHCHTPMGKRLLVMQLKRPLRIGISQDSSQDSNKARSTTAEVSNTADKQSSNAEILNQRLEAVAWFNDLSIDAQASLQTTLSLVADIERISSRIGLHSARPRDLRRLSASIEACAHLDDLLQQFGLSTKAAGLLPLLQMQLPSVNTEVTDVAKLIDSAIIEQPPAHIRDGGMIATGYDADFDKLTHLHDNIQQTLDEMLEEQRQKHQLSGLKVGFNKVSGFYFELPKGQTHLAPDEFIRRQTLKNSERYVTEALKQLETDYLDAQTNALVREKALYNALLHKLNDSLGDIKRLSGAVAQLDVLINWGILAKQHHWTRPTLEPTQPLIDIQAGRHPVVEACLQHPNNASNLSTATSIANFVANDCQLATQTRSERLMLITGPNMGGKSTYMRQTALITLLACCGSFVPADNAMIGDIDRIFTRIGSADDLAGGKSTFMVEMIETAQILNLASPHSLVLMDEVGRGTSTTDGLAIAYACVLKLAQMRCLTLFATHYFELTQLADSRDSSIIKDRSIKDNPIKASSIKDSDAPSIRNVHVSATEIDGKLLLLHKIQDGAASSSFGLHVAKIAGIPTDVLQVAESYLTASTNKQQSVAYVNNQTELTNSTMAYSNNEAPSQCYLNTQQTKTNANKTDNTNKSAQLSLNMVKQEKEKLIINQYDKLKSELDAIDPDELTPKQALDTLYQLKQISGAK